MIDIPLLIFTDLDGTLLDHHSYEFTAALPLLLRLEQYGVVTIVCTSKTYSEVIHLRKQLNNHAPFIVENGAAIYLPKRMFAQCPAGASSASAYWRYDLCPPRAQWLELIDQNRSRFDDCFEQFSAMSIERIMALTGLNYEQAKRASSREFGEPLHWLGSDEELTEFCKSLADQGANLLTGGRFVHVSGRTDKGVAMRWLTHQFECVSHQSKITISLGDSQNDAQLLDASDYAVAVKSPVQPFPALQRTDNVYYTQAFGPEGWVEGLEYYFRQSHLPEFHSLQNEGNNRG